MNPNEGRSRSELQSNLPSPEIRSLRRKSGEKKATLSAFTLNGPSSFLSSRATTAPASAFEPLQRPSLSGLSTRAITATITLRPQHSSHYSDHHSGLSTRGITATITQMNPTENAPDRCDI
ncbi:hypothetical protein AVEN_245252-1 [Araneus ventricosus]|uniref:Uncharacterized protein n=1 Tax=Araneus ventricosus TaxID=182803 RepID=A0A4Y2EFA0_ARAVE|nr:hypothetical protein AVEN_245252-1 [Araneus ventricosus]